jgi:hypothetical protein
MVVHGFGEKDIHLVGAIVVTKGHYALNMRDIASMGRPGPGKKYHQDDRGSNDGATKKMAEKEDCRKRRLNGR